jgi:hypothetical protein
VAVLQTGRVGDIRLSQTAEEFERGSSIFVRFAVKVTAGE